MAGLVALSLLPSRWSGWLTGVREPVLAVLSPAASPARWLGRLVRPPHDTADLADPAVREIERDRDHFQMLWRQSEQKVGDLEKLVAELQQGRVLHAGLDLAQVVAPIVGVASDLTDGTLQARGGRDRGITKNSVAVVDGVQLVGRVVEVHGMTCFIRPVTMWSPSARASYLRAVVDVGENAPVAGLPMCQLTPQADGTLRGELDADARGVEVGQVVRLRDLGWPEAAQMKVLGRVVEVKPKETQPLRKMVTVKPDIDLRRVSQVVLYTPRLESDGAGSDGGAGTGGRR
ncbi:MAG: rod shape-determining protein MreC [Phycisphaerales bacterium]